MLSAISRVVMLCCWTAEAMLVDAFANSPIARVIEEISSTDRLVASWIAATCCEMSSVAREVWLASDFTSAATTAKPLPASPARAASIRGVERQEIGLSGNRRNGADHRADAFGGFGQR